MNLPIPQNGARQVAKDAFSRLAVIEKRVGDVEQTISKVLMAINQVIGQLSSSVDQQAETVEAMVQLTGPQEVAQAIAELRGAKLRQQADRTKTEIAKLITEGQLKHAEAVVGEMTLIVGKEVDKDGVEIPPGYAAVRFTQLKPDYQGKLIGKKLGELIESENGGKFTILELYEMVPPKPATENTPPADAAPQPPPAEGATPTAEPLPLDATAAVPTPDTAVPTAPAAAADPAASAPAVQG